MTKDFQEIHVNDVHLYGLINLDTKANKYVIKGGGGMGAGERFNKTAKAMKAPFRS
jgi:hypothetical protein